MINKWPVRKPVTCTIKKPLKEMLEAVCATFSWNLSSFCYLLELPTFNNEHLLFCWVLYTHELIQSFQQLILHEVLRLRWSGLPPGHLLRGIDHNAPTSLRLDHFPLCFCFIFFSEACHWHQNKEACQLLIWIIGRIYLNIHMETFRLSTKPWVTGALCVDWLSEYIVEQ